MHCFKIKRFICALLCVLLILPASALAISDEEDVTYGDMVEGTLTQEEQAQWDQWEEEDAAIAAEGSEESQALALLDQIEEDNLIKLDNDNLYINPNLPDSYINILLIGVDSRDPDEFTGLNDVDMICSISKETGEIKLTSITRDTAVEIPGKKNMYKLNCTHSFGDKNDAGLGNQLTVQTVNKNFEMNIQYYVTVNIFGLADVIDSLGGVDIELTKAEANRINYELRKEPLKEKDKEKKASRVKVEGYAGVHHLDGMQAVTYARIRGLDNDFVRTERQRKLLSTLLSQIMQNMDLMTMVNLIDTAIPYVQTNLDLDTIFTIGSNVLNSGIVARAQSGETLLTQHRVPMDSTYGYKTLNGASVTWMSAKNKQTNIESIHEFIYGQYYPAE